MHILITGSAGLIGSKLLNLLSSEGMISDEPITQVTLADVTDTHVSLPIASFVIRKRIIDLSSSSFSNEDDECSVEDLISERPDFIFHLAGVSGEAEYDFDRGYRVNVDGTKRILDAIRSIPRYTPRFVFASSTAASSLSLTGPQGSYETQKAIAELLLSDYSRQGHVDGISLRLPTIVVRPGAPDRTATSFFSSIIREPLIGQETACPVPLSFRHTIASPKSAAGYLLHAANLTTEQLAITRTMNMPGITLSINEIIDSITRVTGKSAIKLIRKKHDTNIERIASTWPQGIDATYALSLGFVPDESIDQIVKAYMDEDLPKLHHQQKNGSKHAVVVMPKRMVVKQRSVSGIAA